MRLKTILNHGLNFKCFCIGKSEFNEKKILSSWKSKLELTVSLFAVSAERHRPAMIHCRNGCLSSSRCGDCACSFAMRCVGSAVRTASVLWLRKYRGVMEKSFHKSLRRIPCFLGKRTFMEKRSRTFSYLLANRLHRCRMGSGVRVDASKFRLRNRTGR